VFLRQGFAGASVDEIAAEARVSKPTIYAHFGSKEELFRRIIAAIVADAQSALTAFTPAPAQGARDVIRELSEYAEVWMRNILQPNLLALRRLVIGEAVRFPDLALAYYQGGPAHVEAQLATRLGQLAEAGYLTLADPLVAACVSVALEEGIGDVGEDAVPDVVQESGKADQPYIVVSECTA
jgi:AcrR family transcriptional regulator